VKKTSEEKEVVLNPEISKWRKDQLVNSELMEDVREKGQLQNLIARRLADGKIELIAGHRRYLALKALGKKPSEMDIKILDKVSDVDAFLMAVAENQHRKDMDPVEEARAFKSLQKLGMDVVEIGFRVKRSETYVRNRLELLQLPEKIQQFMEGGNIEMSYAKPLRRLGEIGEKAQLVLAHDIIEGKKSYYGHVNSVDEAEEFVEKVFAAQKYTEKLVAKYGPCPACGSKDIGEASYGDENKLICRKCEHEWHKKTKDPWKLYELKNDAEKLGLKLEVGEGKAKLSPEDMTEIMKRVKAEKARIDDAIELPKTMRTTRTVSELLAPFITPEKLVSFRIAGEEITIRLIEDSKLTFTARKHNYQTGDKTRVTAGSLWDEKDKDIHRKRVQKYVETLQKS